jgi:starch-binding outer membrane protein SusE/F
MRTWLNKIMLVGIAAMAFSSCEKDEVKTVLVTGTTPTLQSNATTLVLLQANANNDAVKFTYTTNASFGFDAAVTYVLQIAKGGTSFASASTTEVGLSKTAPLEKTFKVVDFNRELLKIITYGVATPVEVRVKASVATTAPPLYSNVVTMTCTAYRDIITYAYPNALNIAGNFQGWSPGSAPQIANKNNGGYTNATNNKFEGYIIFNNATPEFKMVRGNAWVGDFGSAGGNNLRDGGPNLTLPSGGAGIAGYWRIRADLSAAPAPGQWFWDKINTWGIIGEFNGWSVSDPLTFNASTGVWTITRDMPAGKFKFRANNDWAINFGDKESPGDFKPEYGDAGGNDIVISVAGNYTISLDLSVGGNYAYTLKKN